jgi:hypothetical protein
MFYFMLVVVLADPMIRRMRVYVISDRCLVASMRITRLARRAFARPTGDVYVLEGNAAVLPLRHDGRLEYYRDAGLGGEVIGDASSDVFYGGVSIEQIEREIERYLED